MRDWLIYRTFWDLTVSGVALGLIYALVALGYTMVYGVLRLINFAHSEIFMVGTFGVLISLTQVFGINLSKMVITPIAVASFSYSFS